MLCTFKKHKWLQSQYVAEMLRAKLRKLIRILCLTHNDNFPIPLLTKKEFLSLHYGRLVQGPCGLFVRSFLSYVVKAAKK